MWFKNKRKIEELENCITKINNFNSKMIEIGAFNGCVGKYVRTVDGSNSFSHGDAVMRIGLPSQIYRIVMVNEQGSLFLQDCNGRMRDFHIDKILRPAFDDEINDFKQQEFKNSKQQINKGKIRGDTVGRSNQ